MLLRAGIDRSGCGLWHWRVRADAGRLVELGRLIEGA